MRSIVNVGAAIPLMAAIVLAQSHVTIRDSDAPLKQASIVPLEEKLALLRQVVWGNPENPEEAGVIASDEALYKDLFRLRLAERTGDATVTREGDDLALARFNVEGQSGVNEVLVWDEPTFTSYIFRLDPKVILDRARLANLLENLFAWSDNAPPTSGRSSFVKSCSIYISKDPKTGELIESSVLAHEFFPFQVQRFEVTMLEIRATSADALLDVSIGKRLTRYHKPEMTWIAERFPPLSERVKEWSKDRLKSELGKGGRAAKLPFGAMERDQVLLKELMTRDLSLDEFRWLLHRETAPNDSTDPTSVLAAAVREKVVKRYESPIRELLAEVEGRKTRWPGNPYDAPFDRVLTALRTASDIDLTKDALEHLRSGDASISTLFYLDDRLERREDYEALLQIKMNDRLISTYEFILPRLQKRLGLTDPVKR